MDRIRALKANIWKLQLAEFLRWMLFFIPILIPFLTDKGLTLPEIFVLQSAFAITIVLFEVPSGYFADLVGRKQSLLLGTALAIIALAVYATGEGFSAFLLAEIIAGIGASFKSGADHAMLYDTLAELGQSSAYVRHSGQMEFLARIGEGVAAVIAGFLAASALALPFWVTLGIFVIAFFVYLTLVEPERHRHVGKHATRMLAIFVDTVHKNKALKWIIAYATVLGVSTKVAAWMYQPLFIEAGIDIAWFGVLWAATLFVAGGAAWLTEHVDSRIGRHRALWVMLGLSAAGYLLTGLVAPVVGVATIMLIQVARGMTRPLINDEINALTPSDRRATVLSIRSLAHNIVFAAVIVGFGVIAQQDLQFAFRAGAALFGVAGALTLIVALVYHRHKE